MATKLQTWRLAARLRGVATGRKKKPFTGAFGVLEAGWAWRFICSAHKRGGLATRIGYSISPAICFFLTYGDGNSGETTCAPWSADATVRRARAQQPPAGLRPPARSTPRHATAGQGRQGPQFPSCAVGPAHTESQRQDRCRTRRPCRRRRRHR